MTDRKDWQAEYENRLGLQALDLKDFTAKSGLRAKIRLTPKGPKGPEIDWIEASNIDIQKARDRDRVRVSSYLADDATDGEHDRAYAFSFQTINFQFDRAYAGLFIHSAWIHPRIEPDGFGHRFHIPEPDESPLKGAEVCEWGACDPHPIVRYLPDHNKELYDNLRGMRIEIFISASDS